MKRIAILTVFLFAAAAWGQVGIPPGVIFGNPTPGGACSIGAGQLVTSTGVIYTCVSSVWTATGTASFPGVTSNGANGLAIAGSLYTNAEHSNGTCTTAMTIDPANGNRQSLALTAANTCVLSFTQPSTNTATVQLRVIQSSSGSFNGGIVGGFWPGGSAPTITQASGAVDFIICYLDGSNAYCAPLQNFSIPLTTTPTYDVLSGTYNNDQSVTISDSQSGAVTQYCTGTSCSPSTPYSSPVTINATGTHLRANALAPGYATSSTQDQTYTLQVATPSPSPSAGSYTSTQSVTLTDTTTGAAMATCTDTSNSCSPGTSYSGPVSVSVGRYLRASGTKTNYTTSATLSAYYAQDFHTSNCSNLRTATVTSVACSAAISVTAGDILIITAFTGSTAGKCTAGTTGDLTGLPGGSTVTVLAHCVSGGSPDFFGVYQVVSGATGSFTPAVTVPSQAFAAMAVDGFTGLSTGFVGSVLATGSSAGTTTTTLAGPTITPTQVNQVVYGFWWQQNASSSNVTCAGGAPTCTNIAVNVDGSPGVSNGTYYGSVGSVASTVPTLHTNINMLNSLMVGLVLQ